jgi:phosphoribosylaminoimidazole (AIR) synthetase
MRKLTYANAGVDINLENRSIDAMKAGRTRMNRFECFFLFRVR